jgi:hypothetical protein
MWDASCLKPYGPPMHVTVLGLFTFIEILDESLNSHSRNPTTNLK